MLYSYDALLAAGSSWIELCNHAVFHAGDSDSTGCIAGAWYGALYGFDGVPEVNYKVRFNKTVTCFNRSKITAFKWII